METRTFFECPAKACEKPLPSNTLLEWCAFLKGADVGVKEVRMGVRVTATYLLRGESQDRTQGPSLKGLPLIPHSHKALLNLSRFDLIKHPLFAKMSVKD